MNRSTQIASAAVFLSAALWGLFWVPVRYFNDHGIGGEWAIILLYLPALLVLLPALLIDFRRQRVVLRTSIIVGFFIGLGLAAYGVGILYTSVIRATLLFYLTPVWSTLIGMYWLDEGFDWRRWVAIAVGLVGLSLLMASNANQSLNVGDALAFLSGIFWAIGATVIRKNGSIPILGMSFFQFLFAVLFVLCFGSVFGTMEFPNFETSAPAFLITATISVFMVLPAIFLLFWASQLLSPGRVGLLMMSEALVAVMTASVFLPEENLNVLQWVGAILIIGSALMEIKGGKA